MDSDSKNTTTPTGRSAAGTGGSKPTFFRKISSSFLDESASIVPSPVPSPYIAKLQSRHDQAAQGNAKRFFGSFVVVYTMIFFNGCCFTAVVPSVPFYLEVLGAEPTFLGVVIAAYSMGQIVGSPTGGFLADKLSSRIMLTLSSSLGLISSVIYSLAPNPLFILLARFLTGISAGTEFSTELAFIARNTTKKERTVYLASVTAVNVIGFIMGPALGGVIAMLNISIMGVNVDKYTGPGWLLVTMFFVDIFLVQTFFKDSTSAAATSQNAAKRQSSTPSSAAPAEQTRLLDNNKEKKVGYGEPTEDLIQNEGEGEQEAPITALSRSLRDSERPPSFDIVLGLIFVQFTVMCAWSLLETITSPLAQDNFGWDVQECNILFTGGGVVSLISYLVFVVASKWVADRWLIICALLICLSGQILAIDWQQLEWAPEWLTAALPPYLARFLPGYALMNAGFMLGRPVTFALYSKLIGSEFQGRYLGWMVAGGSLARTLGPFAAVAMYYHIKTVGINLLALFGTVGIFHVACLLLVIFLWQQLLPQRSQMSIRQAALSDEEKGLGLKSSSKTFTPAGIKNGGGSAKKKDVRLHTSLSLPTTEEEKGAHSHDKDDDDDVEH